MAAGSLNEADEPMPSAAPAAPDPATDRTSLNRNSVAPCRGANAHARVNARVCVHACVGV